MRIRGIVQSAALSLVLFVGACAEPPLPEWHDEGDYRWREVRVPRGSDVGFTSLESSRTGLDFVNAVQTNDALANRHLTHGSGVALGDVDGDGLSDLLLGAHGNDDNGSNAGKAYLLLAPNACNTPPRGTQISIEPDDPVEGEDDLVCTIDEDAYDADGSQLQRLEALAATG